MTESLAATSTTYRLVVPSPEFILDCAGDPSMVTLVVPSPEFLLDCAEDPSMVTADVYRNEDDAVVRSIY